MVALAFLLALLPSFLRSFCSFRLQDLFGVPTYTLTNTHAHAHAHTHTYIYLLFGWSLSLAWECRGHFGPPIWDAINLKSSIQNLPWHFKAAWMIRSPFSGSHSRSTIAVEQKNMRYRSRMLSDGGVCLESLGYIDIHWYSQLNNSARWPNKRFLAETPRTHNKPTSILDTLERVVFSVYCMSYPFLQDI